MASIKKRGKSYLITVSNGYDSSGKKINRYATFTPDPNKTEKQNQRALDEFTHNFEKRVKDGLYFDGENMTLEEFANKWLTECVEPKKAATTYANYKMNLQKHIIPALGHLKIAKIKPLHIQKFYNDLASGSRIDGRKGVLSKGTIKKIHAVLSSMLHRAVLWQIIESNPCQRVEIPDKNILQESAVCSVISNMADVNTMLSTVNSLQTNEKCFSIEEANLFLHILGQSSLPFQIKVFLNLALFSGCRRGELLALTWQDIDFESCNINIYKSVALCNHQLIIKTPKTRTSVRTISLPKHLIQMIQQLKTEQKRYSLKLGSAWVGHRGSEYDNNFLFTQWDGSLIYPTTPYADFKKLIKNYNKTAPVDAQLPLITLHGLRHTSATLLISQNVDIKTVSHRLGHSQTSTTMNIYAHSLKKMDESAANALEHLLIKEK